MAWLTKSVKRLLDSPDLRILSLMIAGAGVFGVVDGSFWKSLLSPTVAYRPAILFGFTLVFGWRGFAWSQVVFLAAFASFFSWRVALFIELIYLLSHACALVVARRITGGEPWLSRQRSALAVLAGAALAPALPALLDTGILHALGVPPRPGVPPAVESWLRGVSGMCAVVPAALAYGSWPLKKWAGLQLDREWKQSVNLRNAVELALEMAVWGAALWTAVQFKARYGLNITYVAFLPLLVFTLLRGMGLATLALAGNAVIATTLWMQLRWANILSVGDLRLLVTIYSTTVLLLAAAVDERRRDKAHLANLLTSEAILRESEEHFRAMADCAPVMIWVSGPDKLWTFFNKLWLDFTGRSMEQEIGNGWADGIHPEDLNDCFVTYSSSFDAHRDFRMEYRLRRADGEYRWILDYGTPLYKQGGFAGYIGSCIDVTDQKLMAERLQAQKLQLTEAQRLAKLGSWERHVETGRVDWSDETLRILGLSNNPQAGVDDFLNRVHPVDREKILTAAAEVRSSASPVELDYRLVRPDGEVRFVRAIVEAVRDNRGAPIRTVGSMQDITEQRKAEELLRESEGRLKSAERLAHVGHWQWDLQTNRLSGSEEVFRIFDKPPDYVPSYEDFIRSVVPRDRERVARWIRDCIAEKRGKYIEYHIAVSSGECRTISSVAEVLLDSDGVPACLFGATQDITDSRRAQEESFSRQKLESIGTLAGGIAHDFNNLLGGVLAQAEVALERRKSRSFPEEELTHIRDVAIRGSEIVRQLMVYAGKESESVGLVDVSRVTKEMAELLKVSISKHAVLETDLGQDLPSICGTPGHIQQIVMNLVMNASEAMGDRDGFIRVMTRRHHDPTGESTKGPAGAAEDNCLSLEVSDTGCGMSRETLDRVFDPFFTTKSAGRGLGLSVVSGIVRRLGGTIRIHSEPGKGSTFQVLLPFAEGTEETARHPNSVIENMSRPSWQASILVVEDEDVLRQAVSKMLRKTGLDVFEAGDGSLAIDLLQASPQKIDLILLDMTIPGASSQEVVAAAATIRPEIRVILTSAYGREIMAEAAGAPQVRGFIRKPYRFADLLEMLRQATVSRA